MKLGHGHTKKPSLSPPDYPLLFLSTPLPPGAAAMAAAFLTLSAPTPTLLPLSNSLFKGNTTSLKLKQNPSSFPSLTSTKSRLIIAAAGASALPTAILPAARLRLDNLGPQPGSRKRRKRKGRGIAAGQGNSCGFGMRGQKSRSGPGVRKGFEGGQMPLYRRIPKLRGIAGGITKSRLCFSFLGVWCCLGWFKT